MLLRAGYIMTLRQVLDDLLSDPTALEDARLGVGEAPFQVGYDAAVGGLLAEVVWVLQIEFVVGSSYGMMLVSCN